MAALTVQNFASAAAGIAIAIALVRGFARQEKKTIGNFWVDVTRATVYVLLPLSIIAGLLFVSQGVIQNLHPYTTVSTVEGRETNHRARTGRVSGSDQAARDKRRRFLQCKLLASIRKSNAAEQSAANVSDFPDSSGADVHVRKNDQGYQAGLGHFRGILGHVSDRRVRRLPFRASRQSHADEIWVFSIQLHPANPAATWRARKSASALRIPRCSPPSRRMRVAAR